MSNLAREYTQNERIATLVSYLFVAAMMYCVGVTALRIAERIAPDWGMDYLPVMSFLISLLAINSQLRMRRTMELDTSAWVYRVVEMIVMLVVLKAATYISGGVNRLLQDLPLWQENFLESFFSAEYLFGIVVVLLIWGLSTLFAQDLADLEGDVIILQAENSEGLTSNRNAVQQKLAGRIFTLGVGMVFMMALVRKDIAFWGGGAIPASQGVFHILTYFMIGLAMLSLTQLATRRASWAWEHIPVGHGMVNRWVVSSLGFLAMVVLIAFILPTGYTVGFLPALNYLLGALITVLYFLVMLVILPLFYLIALVVRLFGLRMVASPPALNLQRLFPSLQQTDGAPPPLWFEVVKSILFWTLLLGVVGYAIYLYLNQNREFLMRLRRLPGLAWTVKAWRWVVSRFHIGVELVPKIVEAGLKRLKIARKADQVKDGFHFVSLRRLSPRQRVVFYYLALLRRSEDIGVPRQSWQTPREHTQTLIPYLPEVTDEVGKMAEEFYDARYSRHPVSVQRAEMVKHTWERVRGILKNRHRH